MNDKSIERIETGLAGDRAEIAATVSRIKAMTNIPPNAPDYSIWGLAQMSVAMDLNLLNGEIYLGEFGGKFLPIVGVNGYAKEARQQSEFQYEYRVLDEMELSVHNVKDGSYGVEITLYNYKKAREAKDIGIPYIPVKAFGFWHKGDNIPKTWTLVMVAEKRALKTALRKEFSFRSFEQRIRDMGGSTDDEFETQVYEVVEGKAQKEEERTSPIIEAETVVEENGLLFAASRNGSTKQPDPIPDSTEDLAPYKNILLNRCIELDEHERRTLRTLRENQDPTTCSPKEYGKLVGRMAAHGITIPAYRKCANAILFGGDHDKENRPPRMQAKSLYEWLGTEETGGDPQVHAFLNRIPGIIEVLSDPETHEKKGK